MAKTKVKALYFSPEDMTRRAFAAWFKTGGMDAAGGRDSGCEEHDGKHYVVLRNIRGVMAVYRIGNDGNLRRMKRPPKTIEAKA